MMTLEDAFADSVYDMELEKIKNKIMKLYTDLVEKTFRTSKPGASEEEIQAFQDANALEFKGVGFNDEADGLEKLLELLMQDEDLDETSEMDFEEHDVAKGDKLKESKDKTTAPLTEKLKDHKGGLFTPEDLQKKVKTKALKTPRGKIERLIDDEPKVQKGELKDIWDAEREKLLQLVRKRNKEHGVKLW